jgi:type IV pilus assembly protein PilV
MNANDATARPQSAARATDGFTLLEVLVALLVLSVGLLGLAALQTTGLSLTHQSQERTQAVIQAYDILDRIRANPVAKTAGDYDNVALNYVPSSPPDCFEPATACTPAQMAAYDISEWKKAIAALLAQGKGGLSTPGGVRTVTITWSEKGTTMTLVVEAQI